MPTRSQKTPSDVGTLWILRRLDGRARCALLSWPEDWELRVVIDGDVLLARHCPDTDEAFALAEAWKHDLLAQGWKQVVPRSGNGAASLPRAAQG